MSVTVERARCRKLSRTITTIDPPNFNKGHQVFAPCCAKGRLCGVGGPVTLNRTCLSQYARALVCRVRFDHPSLPGTLLATPLGTESRFSLSRPFSRPFICSFVQFYAFMIKAENQARCKGIRSNGAIEIFT